MKLVFLEGYGQLRQLAKTFIRRADGTLIKQAYPNAQRMTSYSTEVDTLDDFEEALKTHAVEYRALFTGQLTKELKAVPRKGMAVKNNKMGWMCLDFDNVEADSVEQIISEIEPLANTSYIVAYSASHGFKPGVNAHVFFMLDTPAGHDKLTTVVTSMNWFVPRLREQLRLSESKAHLSKKLDTAGVRPAGLVYIAPPILKGVEDPCIDLNGRIKLVRKPHDVLSLADFPDKWLTDVMTKHQMRAHLDELRRMEGLPPIRDTVERMSIDGVLVDYDTAPDHTHITLTGGPISVNGLVRCNVNDGDSGAYYFNYGYITDGSNGTNVTLMNNFKGETAFALAAANPGFATAWNDWLRAQEATSDEEIPEWLKNCPVPTAGEVTSETDDGEELKPVPEQGEPEDTTPTPEAPARKVSRRMIFRDGFTDQHYEFELLEETATPMFSQISTDTARKQAAKYGLRYSKEEGFDTLYRVFDPTQKDLLFEIDGKPMINLFAHPKTIRYDAPRMHTLDETVALIKEKCPTIYLSVAHPLCYDEEAIRRMFNWMTVHTTMPHIRVNTAWLLRGIPGSGKSNIVQGVLSTVLGYGFTSSQLTADATKGYCSNISTDSLTSGFSGMFLESRFMEIAEAETGGTKDKNHEMLKQTFKRLVTQEYMDINEKYGRQRKNVRVFNAFVFTSNYHDTFPIDIRDRRYNVPRFQDQPIKDVIPQMDMFHQEYVPLVLAEAETFGALISAMQPDLVLVQSVYDGGDKDEIIEAGQPVGDLFVGWLKTGNYDRVAEAILSGVEVRQSGKGLTAIEEAAIDYLSYVVNVSDSHKVSRDFIQKLYAAAFPSAASMSTTAFSRKMTAAGMTVSLGRVSKGMADLLGGSTQPARCTDVHWKSETFEEWRTHPRLVEAYKGMQSKQQVARMAAG
jgi:hypothetical protein